MMLPQRKTFTYASSHGTMDLTVWLGTRGYTVATRLNGKDVFIDQALKAVPQDKVEEANLIFLLSGCLADGTPATLLPGVKPNKQKDGHRLRAFHKQLEEALRRQDIEKLDDLLRRGCDHGRLRRACSTVAAAVQSIIANPNREEAAAIAEEIRLAANKASNSLQRTFSLMSGSHVRQVKRLLSRLALVLGPAFEYAGFPQVDVVRAGNNLLFAQKMRTIAAHAGFFYSGILGRGVAAEKLAEDIRAACARQQIDEILLPVCAPVWQDRAARLKELLTTGKIGKSTISAPDEPSTDDTPENPVGAASEGGLDPATMNSGPMSETSPRSAEVVSLPQAGACDHARGGEPGSDILGVFGQAHGKLAELRLHRVIRGEKIDAEEAKVLEAMLWDLPAHPNMKAEIDKIEALLEKRLEPFGKMA